MADPLGTIGLIVSAVFGVLAFAVVVRGVVRRESRRRVRQRACAAGVIAVIGLRSVVPNSRLGETAYFGAMVALVAVALWKTEKPAESAIRQNDGS